MERFLTGTTVNFNIPLVDRMNNEIAATAATARIVARGGIEVAAVTGVTVAAGRVSFTLPAEKNVITDAEGVRDVRFVELTCTTPTGERKLNYPFMIEADAALVVGTNSFVTYEEAELLACNMYDVGEWDLAQREEKERALSMAHEKIGAMTFSQSPYTNFDELSATDIAALPAAFLKALKNAQVADAVATITPDKVAERRSRGLILDTIGETKQMFSNAIPLYTPVSKNAMRYLQRWLVSTSMRVGRS